MCKMLIWSHSDEEGWVQDPVDVFRKATVAQCVSLLSTNLCFSDSLTYMNVVVGR